MDAEYLVIIDGKPSGPYSIEVLKGMNISGDTFVKGPGMTDYKEVCEVRELSDNLGIRYQAVPVPQYYASPDIRLLAVVIDYLLAFAFCLIFLLIMLPFAGSDNSRVILSVSGIPFILLVKITMGIVMEASARQATFGKSWLGIKITDEEGRRISAGRSAFRNLMKIVCFLTLGIGYLTGFFNRRHQCLHDIIARTLAVKKRLI